MANAVRTARTGQNHSTKMGTTATLGMDENPISSG